MHLILILERTRHMHWLEPTNQQLLHPKDLRPGEAGSRLHGKDAVLL